MIMQAHHILGLLTGKIFSYSENTLRYAKTIELKSFHLRPWLLPQNLSPSEDASSRSSQTARFVRPKVLA